MVKKGFTLAELIVAVVIVGIILGFSLLKYRKWVEESSIEKDTRLIYTVINNERMVALSQGRSFRITVNGTELVIKDMKTNVTRSIELRNPFSGTIDVYSNGLMKNNVSIVFQGDLSLNPDVSCVISNGLRLRMGQTYVSQGKRKCR